MTLLTGIILLLTALLVGILFDTFTTKAKGWQR